MILLTRRRLSRRAFLGSLGAAALASPLVPMLRAHADDSGYPRRLILFFTPHATYWPAWRPSAAGTTFNFGPILAPLAPFRAKVNILQGVQMRPSKYFVAHTPGGAQLWTGSELSAGPQNSDGSYAYGDNTGPSVDQVVAQQIGLSTAYSSLQFGTWTGQTTIFGGPARPLSPAQDPDQAFARLFSTLSTQALADRSSVLDTVTAQLTALRARLGASDAQKLEAHLTGVRSLETRLQRQSIACKGPSLTPQSSDPTRLAALMDLTAAALACDLTRVVSLQFGQQDNDGGGYPFLNISAGHHPLTHLTPSDTLDDNGNPVSDPTRSVNGQLTRIYTWYAQQFAGLLRRLDAVAEGNGTMLDNTLVVWGSELANYSTHSFSPSVPFVLAGGAGGQLTGGRSIDLSAAPQDHNRLLVSICQLMGLAQTQTFGNMDVGQGPLAAL